VIRSELAVVPRDELRRRRERGEVGTEAGELPALADLVVVLDRVEGGRVDLVGQRLQLGPVALDLGLDDRGQLPALDLLDGAAERDGAGTDLLEQFGSASLTRSA